MPPTVDDAGLYVHVPFCARACPYCDFDFQVGRHPATGAFLEALACEIGERGVPRTPATVYVGGGTPSLLGPEGVAALFEQLARACDLSISQETTVELNPEHVDAALVETLVRVGVHRVSLGAQSFDAQGLRMLGRVHDGATAATSVRRCLDAGLRVSVDLIVGWPGQTSDALFDDIDRLVDLGVRHVSAYALTIEENTPWVALARRGKRRLPGADAQADLLTICASRLEAAGLHHYEISSYAASGEEALHNSGYWTWRDYVGLGPSAASASFTSAGGVVRRMNLRGIAAWRARPQVPAQTEHLEREAAAGEGLWTGLRRLDGIDLEQFERRFCGVDRAWIEARIARQLAWGNLERSADGRTLRVARDRWLCHDEICADLIA